MNCIAGVRNATNNLKPLKTSRGLKTHKVSGILEPPVSKIGF